MDQEKADAEVQAIIDRLASVMRGLLEVCRNETDRGTVLVAAEFLSDSLNMLLRVKFTSTQTSIAEQKKLLKGIAAPFGSFGMRIAVCRAFALLPPEHCSAMNALREVRNYFAHSTERVGLSDTAINKWVRQLLDYLDEHNTPATADRLMINLVVLKAIKAVISNTQEISRSMPGMRPSDMPPIEPQL